MAITESSIIITSLKAGAITSASALFLSDINYVLSLFVGLIAFVVVVLKEYVLMQSETPKPTKLKYISVTTEKFFITIGVVMIVMFGLGSVTEKYFNLDLNMGVMIGISICAGIFHTQLWAMIKNFMARGKK